MGILYRLFGWGRSKKEEESDVQSDVEEFMSLIRIYYQSSIISQVGITNLNMVPEFAMYKRMMRIPTVSGKLGVAEKSHVRKTMIADYKMNESFFKEIDASIRRNCKSVRDMQGYFFTFGNFTNDLMTYLSTEVQWKLQGAMLFKKLLRPTIKSAINKMMTKATWKEATTATTISRLRASKATLNYSDDWLVEFSYQVLIQSKKDSKKR